MTAVGLPVLAIAVEWSVPVLVLLYPLAIVTIVLGLLTPWLGRPPVVHRFAIGFVAVAGFLVGLLVHRVSGGRAEHSPVEPARTLA